MAESDVIREFLVKLGFELDQPGFIQFIGGIGKATLAAAGLGAAVVAAVAKLSEASEQLYFMSQRTKAGVAQIQSYAFAVSQLGGTAEGAKASLENLANFLRASPGAKGIISALGINPAEDPTKIMTDLGAKFRQMPIYRAQMLASMFGIDQKTMFALMSGLGQFSAAYADMLKKAGVNSQAAAASSHAFMIELRLLGAAFDILAQKVNQNLAGPLGQDIKSFRLMFVNNFGLITHIITEVTTGILNTAEVILRLILRAAQGFNDLSAFFQTLSGHTQHVIEAFAALLIGWRLLNTAFMNSPLGIIAALAAGILLLYDDYKTWKEGGKSLIDWKAWQPDIEKAFTALKTLMGWLDQGAHKVGGWQDVLETLALYIGGKWAFSIITAFGRVGGSAAALGRAFLPISLALLAIDAWNQAHKDMTLKQLPIGSPLWQSVPNDQQRMFPNSPYNQQRYPDQGQAGVMGGSNKWTPGWFFNKAYQSIFGTKKQQQSEVSSAIPGEGKALLDVIGVGESGGDYSRSYGTNPDIQSYVDHPRKEFAGPNGTQTSAAGKYQFEQGTWDAAANALGLKDFTPENQDRAAWWLAQRDYKARTDRDLDADLKSGDPKRLASIGAVLNATWISLTGNAQLSAALQQRLAIDTAKPAVPPTFKHPMAQLSLPTRGADVDDAALAGPHQSTHPGSSAQMMAPSVPYGRGGHDMHIEQHNNITINGATDPHRTADAVQKAQRRTHADLMRNLPTRAS
jgi:muramidase (phage lysozyme)